MEYDSTKTLADFALPLILILLLWLLYRGVLRRQEPAARRDKNLQRKSSESKTAGHLAGATVTLQQPLYPGSSKLELNGRYWKVAANRDFSAGTIVEVIGHQGNTLNIIAAESPRYGAMVEQENHLSGSPSFSDYSRQDSVEREYGAPDFDHWQLFYVALQQHRKMPLIYAYHVLSGLKGMHLEQARAQLNTYTLGLYDPQAEGDYLPRKPQMYSQPRVYDFLYMNGQWPGRADNKFEEEINGLIAALHSDWALRYRGDIDAAMVLRAVMMIRKQQIKTSA
jgi:membrane protein implicated in regulation of membrane protease activity